MNGLLIDKEKCKACGLCVFYCPQKCLRLSKSLNKKGYPYVEVFKSEPCRGCGLCVLVCPDGVIRVNKKQK